MLLPFLCAKPQEGGGVCRNASNLPLDNLLHHHFYSVCLIMRRHGWQIPYHPLQVVAVAVLLALAFAFYVFFVPFVGNSTVRLLGICLYSPLMAAVFGLYIWCAATDPADPALLRSKKHLSPAEFGTSMSWETSLEKNACSSVPSLKAETSLVNNQGKAPGSCNFKQWRSACILKLCNSQLEEAASEEDMLYCSLCEVEISKCSKHCRVCDKCVHNFDHHCRWLNNCIGQKNYKVFISLMISGIALLILQWTVGVWVTARCFVNRRNFQDDITSRLGSSFSVVPFLCVVVLCTVLAVVATVPLVKLFFFHALLIHKGISTYDYIVAMREHNQQFGAREIVQSPYASPASSAATALSGASSGMQYQNSWCTPPRLFVDHEQAVLQHEKSRSFGLEDGRKISVDETTSAKKVPVKISPWALARLNTKDVVRAASEARKNSSMLRPVAPIAGVAVIAETDCSSESTSGEVNVAVIPPSTGGDIEARNRANVNDESSSKCSSSKSSRHCVGKALAFGGQVFLGGNNKGYIGSNGEDPLTPLQVEARNAFYGDGCSVQRESSSTGSNSVSPNHRFSCESHPGHENHSHCVAFPAETQRAISGVVQRSSSSGFRSSTDGYEASGGESADDTDRYLSCMNRKYYNQPADYNDVTGQRPLCNSRRVLANKQYHSSTMFDSSPDGAVEFGRVMKQLARATKDSSIAENAYAVPSD